MELALDGKMQEMGGKRGGRKRKKAAASTARLVRMLLGMALMYGKAIRAKRELAGAKGASKRGSHCKQCGGPKHRGPCAAKGPVRALGAMSVGATALGALAVGALAIGALAIKRLAIKRGEVERLDISELKVKRLAVDELLVREETRSQPQTPLGANGEPPGTA